VSGPSNAQSSSDRPADAPPLADLFRLVGQEPLAALDRIVSQEVRSLRDGDGRLALLLAPKGQFRALLSVFRLADEALVLAPPGRGAALAAGIGRYLALSRVTLAPLAAAGGCRVVVGEGAERLAVALGADPAPLARGGCCASGDGDDRTLLLGETFAGVAGVTAWPAGARAAARLLAALRAVRPHDTDLEARELARIRAGFPAWGSELTETVLPPEVGLEAAAISYTKGCYVGQETIARLRSYGHVNRRLVAVRQVGGPDDLAALPQPLLAPPAERPVGALTSCGRDPSLGWIGLALVRREHATPGTSLQTTDGARHLLVT